MTETPLTSVFSRGRYVGAILSRGVRGYEAIAESGESHGFFNSQGAAAAALQEMTVHSSCPGFPDASPTNAAGSAPPEKPRKCWSKLHSVRHGFADAGEEVSRRTRRSERRHRVPAASGNVIC
jgi:hypothetical protein